MSKHHDQIVAAAQGKVEGSIIAAAFAKPRGATTSAAGGGVIASEIGARWSGKQHKGAAASGIEIGNPGAVVITSTALVTLKVGVSFTGSIKEVKEVLSVVPLEDIESIEVSRFGMAGVMEITAGGATFKLEGSKVDDMRAVAEAFEKAKSPAAG